MEARRCRSAAVMADWPPRGGGTPAGPDRVGRAAVPNAAVRSITGSSLAAPSAVIASASAVMSWLRQVDRPYWNGWWLATRSSMTGVGVSQTQDASVSWAAMRRICRRLAIDSSAVTVGLVGSGPPRVTALGPRADIIQADWTARGAGQRGSILTGG